jgi:hypothetical protein
MNKYECTWNKGSGCYTFVVEVKAATEEHAKQMASALASRTSGWPYIETNRWNVSVLDTGYSGDAKVLDYKKLD